MAPAQQFEASSPPGDLAGAIRFAPSTPTRFIAGSWDKGVYVYDIDASNPDEPTAALVKRLEQPAPIADLCFGATDEEVYTGGLDGVVRKVNLETGDHSVVTKYDAAARCVAYNKESSLLISALWDCRLRFHNPQDLSLPPAEVTLPGKPHALSVSPTKAVVAMVARLVHIYDIPTAAAAVPTSRLDAPRPLKPWQTRESSLKFLTRAVACMPSDDGYATSSIEGRVAVEWFSSDEETQKGKYAFKCHRQAASAEEGGGDIVFPVNALAFHPVWGTFVSGGGDGTVALWDAAAKRRMRQYQKLPNSVMALGFSQDGRYLAIATAPGFTTDLDNYSGEGQTQIFIRELGETEAKGKGAK